MAEHGDAHATPVTDGPDFHKTLVMEAIAITVGETDLIANTGGSPFIVFLQESCQSPFGKFLGPTSLGLSLPAA